MFKVFINKLFSLLQIFLSDLILNLPYGYLYIFICEIFQLLFQKLSPFIFTCINLVMKLTCPQYGFGNFPPYIFLIMTYFLIWVFSQSIMIND